MVRTILDITSIFYSSNANGLLKLVSKTQRSITTMFLNFSREKRKRGQSKSISSNKHVIRETKQSILIAKENFCACN